MSELSYVYVLTNPAMPGLVKIGLTDADDPTTRAAQLYTTGVPLPFELEYAGQVVDGSLVERELHNAFRDRRVNPKREFFQIEPDQVIGLLRLLKAEDATTYVRNELATAIEPEERSASERFRSRRPPLNFTEMGIETGEELVYKRDETKTVVVVDARTVRHADTEGGLSRITRDLLGVDYYVAPTSHWTYRGRSLQEIYDETYGDPL